MSVFKLRLPNQLAVLLLLLLHTVIDRAQNQTRSHTKRVYEHEHAHGIHVLHRAGTRTNTKAQQTTQTQTEYIWNIKEKKKSIRCKETYIALCNKQCENIKKSKIVRLCLLKSASPSVWFNVMIQYSFRPRRD